MYRDTMPLRIAAQTGRVPVRKRGPCPIKGTTASQTAGGAEEGVEAGEATGREGFEMLRVTTLHFVSQTVGGVIEGVYVREAIGRLAPDDRVEEMHQDGDEGLLHLPPRELLMPSYSAPVTMNPQEGKGLRTFASALMAQSQRPISLAHLPCDDLYAQAVRVRVHVGATLDIFVWKS